MAWEEMNEAERAALSAAADRLDHIASHVLSAVFDMAKWIMASLLALNGGALIAAAQVDERASHLIAETGGYFVAGCVAAIVAGFGSSIVWALLSGPLIELSLLVRQAPDDFSSRSAPLLRKTKVLALVALVPTLIGVASLVAFGLGSLHAAEALK
jgi:hypothetical protein